MPFPVPEPRTKVLPRFVAYTVGIVDAVWCLAVAGLAGISWFLAGDPAASAGRMGPWFVTFALVAIALLFARSAWLAIRREWRPGWQATPVLGFAALVSWLLGAAKIAERHVAANDRHLMSVIAQARPRLPALATALDLPSGAAGSARCGSTLIVEFPTCIRDGRRVLLLATQLPEAHALHPLEGLVYNPTGEPTDFIGGLYIGGLLEPLGAGWYHVRAYPGLD